MPQKHSRHPAVILVKDSKRPCEKAGSMQMLFIIVCRRQLMLLGAELRSPAQSPLQALSFFFPGTLQPATTRYIRRVGRARKEWVPVVLNSAYQL